MPLVGSLVDWTQMKKEFLSLSICPEKTFTTEKQREKRVRIISVTEYPRTVGQV